MTTDSTKRFDERAADYDRFRPSYPVELMPFFTAELGLDPRDVLVDVGAGTGKLTRILLENGNRVYAVEPSDRMRAIAERDLSRYETFISVGGTAEETNVPDRAANFVFAAQAFHWFDVRGAREEFRRILRGKYMAVLIWNVRNTHESDFLKAYDDILHMFSPGYAEHRREKVDYDKIERLYGPRGYKTAHFPNSQELSGDGLIGRVSSNAYAPSPDDRNYREMLAAVRALYDTFQENGRVCIDYTTHVIYGVV